MSVKPGIAAIALAVAWAAPALAGDGRLEINQACIATGCFPGDAPGLPVSTQPNQSYVLTSSLSIGASSSVVSLAAGSTLDLNGFTIEGQVTCTGAPAVCSESGFNGGGVIAAARSVVKNGTIRGVRSFGIRVEEYVRVENMRVEQNAESGIAINDDATGVLIQDSQIVQNGSAGIALAQGDLATGVRVLRNTIHGNGYAGVTGPISLLLDNAITSNAERGAILNYTGSPAGYARNQFWNNNGGNTNQQVSGGIAIGPNVCGNAACP